MRFIHSGKRFNGSPAIHPEFLGGGDGAGIVEVLLEFDGWFRLSAQQLELPVKRGNSPMSSLPLILAPAEPSPAFQPGLSIAHRRQGSSMASL